MGVFLGLSAVATWTILWPLRASSAGGTIALAWGALALTYPLVAWAVNRSVIEADQWHLSLRHSPLTWPGKRVILIDSLDQLYVKELQPKDSVKLRTWELRARLKQGGEVTLLGPLRDPAQALFLEKELEARLGILDVPVEGAFDPPGGV